MQFFPLLKINLDIIIIHQILKKKSKKIRFFFCLDYIFEKNSKKQPKHFEKITDEILKCFCYE